MRRKAPRLYDYQWFYSQRICESPARSVGDLPDSPRPLNRCLDTTAWWAQSGVGKRQDLSPRNRIEFVIKGISRDP